MDLFVLHKYTQIALFILKYIFFVIMYLRIYLNIMHN